MTAQEKKDLKSLERRHIKGKNLIDLYFSLKRHRDYVELCMGEILSDLWRRKEKPSK